MNGQIGFSVILCAALTALSLYGQAPSARDIQFFESKIRPILVEHCYACHSAEAKKLKGGLRLDYRDGLLKGGDSGPALVAGKPDKSLLIKALRYDNEDLKMPPKGKLPAAVIANFEAWVRMGASDPRDKATPTKSAATWEEMLRTRRQWWSLQPVRTDVNVPAVTNAVWSSHPIDRFLMAKLEQAGLQPGPTADPRTLIRRLSLVLTGLPPTIAQVEEFAMAWDTASAKRQATLENWVDRLLRSPHFGERWARHWMDVVRFSETHGNEWNYDVHHAWRYRDYLIRAFNEDVPYDQFLREHIAGDLLPPRWNKQEQINEAPIGTAFYRFGEVNHDDCIGLPTLGYDILDNQIDTLSKAFQATTVACARCHDHKIDAVSMKDYYALLGILRSSRPVTHTIDRPEVNATTIRRLRELKTQISAELQKVWRRDAEKIDAKRLLALPREKTTWEDPLHVWQSLRDADNLSITWRKFSEEAKKTHEERVEWNRKQRFVSFGTDSVGDRDPWRSYIGPFNPPSLKGWQIDGLALRGGTDQRGDFAVALEGNRVIDMILPTGLHTHAISKKLNGAVRSPILTNAKKRISFQVMGGKHAAVRLVSNNCQLNYRNFKALKSDQWHWLTFDIPDGAGELRCYVELMTKFDNPKFPDQLGTLGGDVDNQRVPWEKAAADPHSYFGVHRIVLHDGPDPPKEHLPWVYYWLNEEPPKNLDEMSHYFAKILREVASHSAPGSDNLIGVRWLDTMMRHRLLSNDNKASPRLEQLVKEYRDTENKLALPRIVPGMADVDDGIEQPVFLRGDCKKRGDIAFRHFLDLYTPGVIVLPLRNSGRSWLADTLTNPANPLTARVMVNRIWHHVFGYGLVRTCDDFGRMGDVPSHPELLDWLATRFVEDGWSVKKLIRLLVTSQAFQMTGRADAKAAETDPLNRWLHHYPARRMEAEAIRDSILATSSRLDRTMYGLSVLPYREGTNEDRRLFPGPLDGNGRRSIYIKVNLMEPARFLSAFDLPGGKVCQGRRDVTNVPAQALAMMNDPFVIGQAEFWAKRLVQRPKETAAARIEYMFQSALGRLPSKEEQERFLRFVEQVSQERQVAAREVMGSSAVWQDTAHALFNMQEFVYIP